MDNPIVQDGTCVHVNVTVVNKEADGDFRNQISYKSGDSLMGRLEKLIDEKVRGKSVGFKTSFTFKNEGNPQSIIPLTVEDVVSDNVALRAGVITFIETYKEILICKIRNAKGEVWTAKPVNDEFVVNLEVVSLE